MTQPKKRGAPPRKPNRITWRVDARRSLHPFANVVERGPEMSALPPAARHTSLTASMMGDPLPGRSALDQRRQA